MHRNWLGPALVFSAAVGAYLLIAYVLLPLLWKQYERRHPALDDAPHITITGDKHPGDPINLGLIGSVDDLQRSMHAAGWHRADPLGLKSDFRIAADTILRRAYPDAPVSDLFLFGRREDFAFEQPVGGDPTKRHHVRFWRSEKVDDQGRPLWFGSGTYDERVGLSYTTGQITHHVAPDVDTERDHVLDTLEKAGQLESRSYLDNFHPNRSGRNGGGDPWRTDGRLGLGTLINR